jgi:ethanolamine utilization protein EutQ (cupin superfamily)
MREYLINFQSMDWENPSPCIRYKAFSRDNQRIRLAEFSEDFAEKNWCTKGHIGYVIEGNISIDFNGKLVNFKSGDGLFIPEGESNKHKAKVAKGEKALVILFEKI